MRTTPEENERMGSWIGERLNQMDGPVRFFLPEGGVSALDAPGQPFWDPTPTRPCSARWSRPCARPATASSFASRSTSTIPSSPPPLSARSVPCSGALAGGEEW